MNLRLPIDCFVRIADGETLFWNRRNTACEIVDGGEAFAAQLSAEWKSTEAIFSSIANAFKVPVGEIQRDFSPIVGELVSQGLIESDVAVPEGAVDRPVLNENSFDARGVAHDDDWTPLGSFFENRRLPAELHIDLSAACTERCAHCYLPDYPVKHLSFGMAKKALHEFREMQGLSVHLTGGECMLHPNFNEICRYCRGLNLNVVILSNMTCCDDERIEFLKECPPQFINVSLYSMKAEEHDAITGLPGSWRKTMDAILACEAAGLHIRLAAPLLKENRGALGGLRAFAAAHHMHLIPEADIVPRCDHDCSNMEHACSPTELEQVVRAEKSLFDKRWGVGKDFSDDAPVCDIGVSRMYLNSTGNYYPCDSMHGYVLGNVATDTLSSVWTGDMLQRLRAIKNRDIQTCRKCPHRRFCKVCPAFNFNATGSPLKTIPSKCALAAVMHKVYGEESSC